MNVFAFFDTLGRDLHYALRGLVQRPMFACTAVLALALGIGANSAIFTIVDAVLLNPLPYPHSDRLVALERVYRNGYHAQSVPVPNYVFWRANSGDILDDVAGYNMESVGLSLSGGDRPELVNTLQVSKNYFAAFGASPVLGRTFSAEEDRPGGARALVISNRLWRRRFAGSASAIGRSLVLNGETYTVVGVLPRHFEPPIAADVWLPLQADPNSTDHLDYLGVVGRLKPDVTLSQANARMQAEADAFRAVRGSDYIGNGETAAAVPLVDTTVGSVRRTLLILMGAVAFVLLIACANVANLLLARASARQREFAVRAAIGAGRARIVRQLLTESLLLASIAATAGLLLGRWGARALLAIAPAGLPRAAELAKGLPLDPSVLLVTLGGGFATAILFGLLPTWQASHTDPNAALKSAGAHGAAGPPRNRSRGFLVVAETALSVVLLVGAALTLRSFVGLTRADPGFDPHNVLTLSTSFKHWNSTAAASRYASDVIGRLESTPGVTAATITIQLPAAGYNTNFDFAIGGPPPAGGAPSEGNAFYRPVSRDYFDVFRIPLLSGRAFDRRDTARSSPVVLINQAMARRFWKGENPIGRQLTIGRGLGPQFSDRPRTIVGVVGSVREAGLARGLQPVMYIPLAQVPDGIMRTSAGKIPLWWTVRTRGHPLAMAGTVEAQLASVDPRLAAGNVRSMSQVLDASISTRSFATQLMGAFAMTALLLAAMGIAGVVAYLVEQRTAEIAIRMALGAPPARVAGLVTRHIMLLTGAGTALGLGGALGLGRLIRSLLYGVGPADPLTYLAAALTLSAAAAAACWIPALRAARVDPAAVLRQ